MSKQYIPLMADSFYHVFNRAVGNEKLFLSDENYAYFLQKLKRHILPIADLFAYSFLPNHFHLLIRVKPTERLIACFEIKKIKEFNNNEHDLSDFVMEQFSNWLNGYSKSFNNMYDRKGALFMDYTKRSEARLESDITSFIFYIHKNAVHHGLTKTVGEWPYDSYNTLMSGEPTDLMRTEIINWFGSKDLFSNFHQQPIELKTKLKDPN